MGGQNGGLHESSMKEKWPRPWYYVVLRKSSYSAEDVLFFRGTVTICARENAAFMGQRTGRFREPEEYGGGGGDGGERERFF